MQSSFWIFLMSWMVNISLISNENRSWPKQKYLYEHLTAMFT